MTPAGPGWRPPLGACCFEPDLEGARLHEEFVFVAAAVLVGGVIAQWLGWRLRVPAIVFLLAGGLLAGPVTGVLDPGETFGDLLFPAVSLAVAVILFEGALGLGWRGVRAAGRTVWLLLTIGAAITLIGAAIAARYILGIEWNLAVLLATVLVVTGPTVIGPLVRAIGLHGRVGAILEAEGTLIDPLGAILAVLVFRAAFESGDGPGRIALDLLATLGVGGLIGLTGAGVLIVLFARYLLPDELHNVATLATVIGAFAAANAVLDESGLVAVTVMGIVLASQQRVPVHHVLEFNETLRILFISGLFVLLGASIEATTLRNFEWRNVVFLAMLVMIVRPVGAFASTIRSGLSGRQRTFLALTAPRGIVAAAIASVFALRLAELGVENSQVLVAATFTVIAGTVLASGLGSRPLAIRLGLVEATRDSFVVLGANAVAREFAAALERNGASVSLVDLDRREVAAARISGLLARSGSVLADETWEEAGIHSAEYFVAMTGNDEVNTLAARYAAAILGRSRVFQLAPLRPEHQSWWIRPSGTFARPLFARNANFGELARRLDDGWKITSTGLTDKFGPDDHARTHPDALPLFIVDDDGHIALSATDHRRRARAGDTVVTLTPADTPP